MHNPRRGTSASHASNALLWSLFLMTLSPTIVQGLSYADCELDQYYGDIPFISIDRKQIYVAPSANAHHAIPIFDTEIEFGESTTLIHLQQLVRESHTTILPYVGANPGREDVWEALTILDPADSTSVELAYIPGGTGPKFPFGWENWVPEHFLPLLMNRDDDYEAAYSDLHNIRPCHPQMHESARWTTSFGHCSEDECVVPEPLIDTLDTDDTCLCGSVFQPPVHARGVVARSVLYMVMVRYPYLEKDWLLSLSSSNDLPCQLVTLLEWHHTYPPTDDEMQRNQVVCRIQGNRNPLVDHPDWFYQQLAEMLLENLDAGCDDDSDSTDDDIVFNDRGEDNMFTSSDEPVPIARPEDVKVDNNPPPNNPISIGVLPIEENIDSTGSSSSAGIDAGDNLFANQDNTEDAEAAADPITSDRTVDTDDEVPVGDTLSGRDHTVSIGVLPVEDDIGKDDISGIGTGNIDRDVVSDGSTGETESGSIVVEVMSHSNDEEEPSGGDDPCSLLLSGDVSFYLIQTHSPLRLGMLSLVDLPEGLSVYLTDNAWSNEDGFQSNEGTLRLDLPEGMDALTPFGLGTNVPFGRDWVDGRHTSILDGDAGSFDISGADGDNLFVYCLRDGEDDRTNRMDRVNVLAAATTTGGFQESGRSSHSETETSLPIGLSAGDPGILVLKDRMDYYIYSGPTYGDEEGYAAALTRPTNWLASMRRTDLPEATEKDSSAPPGGMEIVLQRASSASVVNWGSGLFLATMMTTMLLSW